MIRNLLCAFLLCLLCRCTVFAEPGEVTVLVYLCGSDLESQNMQASDDLREMIASGIGSTEGLEVLVAAGGAKSWHKYGMEGAELQYYHIGSDGPQSVLVAQQGNMGKPETLSAFLQYGTAHYPADRIILILWDHGAGPVFGVCQDENYGNDPLELDELTRALADGLGDTHLDILAFDACLMNCADTLGATAPYASLIVSSQEMVSGKGLDYDTWMGLLAENPKTSSLDLAVCMADSYVMSNTRGLRKTTATMSVADGAGAAKMLEALDAFSEALRPFVTNNFFQVVRLRSGMRSFGEFKDQDASDLVDIQTVCEVFSSLVPEEAAALSEAAAGVVVYNAVTEDVASEARGLSMFMPYSTVREDRRAILEHYGKEGDGGYATLISAMTTEIYANSTYTMNAAQSAPSHFYGYSNGSASGTFSNIWNGLFGESASMDILAGEHAGNIWSGLMEPDLWSQLTGTVSIWAGLQLEPADSGGFSAEKIWAGLPKPTSIWAGLTEVTDDFSLISGENQAPLASIWDGYPGTQTETIVLSSIWADLLSRDDTYYQPEESNQNLQAGITEAVSPTAVIEAAENYFGSSSIQMQTVYTLQLTRDDLDHLADASGVLFKMDESDVTCMGDVGVTTIDWATGLIFSMFDGTWPMLEGNMVEADLLYVDDEGNDRFVIPARINGIKMYLLGIRYTDGTADILGATQGYDENGFAIRGSIPLETGMEIVPVYTRIDGTGTHFEQPGETILVGETGPVIEWTEIPAGEYAYCFGLTDLSGQVQYTETIPLII